MARSNNRLKALNISRPLTKGRYADGNGLYLQVQANGSKSWLLRYMLLGKAREMGLGRYPDISLAEARYLAQQARLKIAMGTDPIDARRVQRSAQKQESKHAQSFKQCAEAYIASHSSSWKNPKHAAQWVSTLATYVYPVIGDIPVRDITTNDILKILEPIWICKYETASRIRGRLKLILDWATVRKFYHGENPARWDGHLKMTLPPRSRAKAPKHYPALPYAEIGSFMQSLRLLSGSGARALEFAILTASRTNEVLAARWEEFDLEKKIWTIPAERMKANREHRVPLSNSVVWLLEGQRHLDSEYVFSGSKGKPLSTNTLLAVLKRMNRTDITVHGFRSSFRDWGTETTSFSNEVLETALAHVVRDKTEAAYRRGDILEKRRDLMEKWANYCARSGDTDQTNVVKLRAS